MTSAISSIDDAACAAEFDQEALMSELGNLKIGMRSLTFFIFQRHG
jgi:hypothetical protein